MTKIKFGDSIKKFKCRGPRRTELEQVIDDADVAYVLRLTRDVLRSSLGGKRDDVLVMHMIMYCATADEISDEYVYAKLVAIEKQVLALVNEPIGMSFRDAPSSYLLLRVLESLNLVLNGVKKLGVWPADASSQLQVAALAMCMVIDMIDRTQATKVAKGVTSDKDYVIYQYNDAYCLKVGEGWAIRSDEGGHLCEPKETESLAWSSVASRI